MSTQKTHALRLYELLKLPDYDDAEEGPVDIHEIEAAITAIDDLNRWNIKIKEYVRWDEGWNMSLFMIDVENPEEYHTAGMVPVIDYGQSILEFVIWRIIGGARSNWDVYFEDFPMVDEVVRLLVAKGASSSASRPRLYTRWLKLEHAYDADGEYEEDKESKKKYTTIKENLLLSDTRFADTAKNIQRRFRGNKSRVDNSDLVITKYMRSKPGLKEGVWKVIDKGLIDDGIETADRVKFKDDHFNTRWGARLNPCGPGKERNSRTNRCRKVSTKKNKPCGPGKERNPRTNRCRKVSTKKTRV